MGAQLVPVPIPVNNPVFGNQLTVTLTTADPNGAVLDLYRNAGPGSVNDRLGEFHFYGNNSAGTKVQQVSLYAEAASVTPGSESGRFLSNVTSQGALAAWLSVDGETKIVDLGQGFGDPIGFHYRFQTRGPAGSGELNTLFINGQTGEIGMGLVGISGNRLTVDGTTELCRGANYSIRFIHDGGNARIQAYTAESPGQLSLNPDGGTVAFGASIETLGDINSAGTLNAYNANISGTVFCGQLSASTVDATSVNAFAVYATDVYGSNVNAYGVYAYEINASNNLTATNTDYFGAYTFGTLPTPGSTYARAIITDYYGALSWGSAAAGGGSSVVPVWWDGSAWYVG
jgi:hypothetical protein